MAESIIEQCRRANKPLPDAIANAPELQAGLELYFNGFMDLNSCRPIGMAEGAIPWLAVKEYCVYYDITGEIRDDFFYFISRLDEAYLKHKEQKRDIEAKRAKHGKK